MQPWRTPPHPTRMEGEALVLLEVHFSPYLWFYYERLQPHVTAVLKLTLWKARSPHTKDLETTLWKAWTFILRGFSPHIMEVLKPTSWKAYSQHTTGLKPKYEGPEAHIMKSKKAHFKLIIKAQNTNAFAMKKWKVKKHREEIIIHVTPKLKPL